MGCVVILLREKNEGLLVTSNFNSPTEVNTVCKRVYVHESEYACQPLADKALTLHQTLGAKQTGLAMIALLHLDH